jgi:hypothetical protein
VGLGEWLIIGCSVLWAVYTFVGRRGTRSLSPLAMTFGASLTGWLMLTVCGAAAGFAVFAGGNDLAWLERDRFPRSFRHRPGLHLVRRGRAAHRRHALGGVHQSGAGQRRHPWRRACSTSGSGSRF